MKYKLTAWEANGPQDSDFFESYWNDETKQVEFAEVGSTRYACNGYRSNYPAISDFAMLQEAQAWLAQYIFTVIRAAEHRDVLTPQKVERGDQVELTRSCRHKGQVYPAGTKGEVVNSNTFGQFYARGYNRPGRENTRVGIRISPLPGAPTLYFALSAIRLAKEPMSDAELLERAQRLSKDCQFSSASHHSYAWDSENFALALQQKLNKESFRVAS